MSDSDATQPVVMFDKGTTSLAGRQVDGVGDNGVNNGDNIGS
tara:strand:- start:805 stop:930 length:126 start_codon:yes stop_codon:yes gene_type:complete